MPFGTHSFSAQGLRKLASLTHLRRLSLYNVGRHADGASDLLASLPHLEFLHIPYGTQIAGEWAAAAAVRPSIIEINAFRADFSDTGISPLEKMPQLQRLNLSDNAKLTQGAIDRLVAALPSCRIEYGSHSDKKIIEPRSSPAKAAATQQGAPAVMQNGPPPAVFPFDAAAAMKHQEAWAKHLGVPVEFTNGVGMKFRLIPPGEFQMGLGPEFTDEELLRLNRGKDDQKLRGLRMARPAHPVRITRPFYMEVEEVTAGRYRDVVGQLRPEMEQDPNKVLGNLVAWPDAIAFCNKLSEREGKRPAYRIEGAQVTPVDDADGYCLPTEAQWEYACRAGTNTLWYFGSDGGADSNEFRKRCAAPNPFGLTGLYGGANEWCWDATHGNPYRAASVDLRDDPREDVGTSRIKRGGSGNDDSGGNRGAINSFVRIGTPGVPYSPDASRYTGFGRVVLPITAIARP